MKVYFANVLKNCELLEKIFDFDEIWNSKQWTLNFTLIWEKKGCSSLIPLFLRGSGISVYCSFWTYCFYKSDMQDFGILWNSGTKTSKPEIFWKSKEFCI